MLSLTMLGTSGMVITYLLERSRSVGSFDESRRMIILRLRLCGMEMMAKVIVRRKRFHVDVDIG